MSRECRHDRRHSGRGLGRLRQSGHGVGRRGKSGSNPAAYNPFISHAFLSALEASGSATARTGWQPQHLVAEDRRTATSLGVAPCYLEIPFARRIRVRPRLGRGLSSAPAATIIPSCRWRCRSRRRPAAACWSRPARTPTRCAAALAAGPGRACRLREASSVHVTFLPEAEWHAPRRARLPAAHRPAVPLGERRLRDVRRFPRRARLAQAQGHPARAARGARATASSRAG